MNCADFSDPTTELPGIDVQFFHGKNVDLRAIADAQLIACGVAQKNIERHPDCTRCRPDIYWTYRGGDREAVLQGKTNVTVCQIL
jgi:copper oxidase (laccase) domain-containing protein